MSWPSHLELIDLSPERDRVYHANTDISNLLPLLSAEIDSTADPRLSSAPSRQSLLGFEPRPADVDPNTQSRCSGQAISGASPQDKPEEEERWFEEDASENFELEAHKLKVKLQINPGTLLRRCSRVVIAESELNESPTGDDLEKDKSLDPNGNLQELIISPQGARQELTLERERIAVNVPMAEASLNRLHKLPVEVPLDRNPGPKSQILCMEMEKHKKEMERRLSGTEVHDKMIDAQGLAKPNVVKDKAKSNSDFMHAYDESSLVNLFEHIAAAAILSEWSPSKANEFSRLKCQYPKVNSSSSVSNTINDSERNVSGALDHALSVLMHENQIMLSEKENVDGNRITSETVAPLNMASPSIVTQKSVESLKLEKLERRRQKIIQELDSQIDQENEYDMKIDDSNKKCKSKDDSSRKSKPKDDSIKKSVGCHDGNSTKSDRSSRATESIESDVKIKLEFLDVKSSQAVNEAVDKLFEEDRQNATVELEREIREMEEMLERKRQAYRSRKHGEQKPLTRVIDDMSTGSERINSRRETTESVLSGQSVPEPSHALLSSSHTVSPEQPPINLSLKSETRRDNDRDNWNNKEWNHPLDNIDLDLILALQDNVSSIRESALDLSMKRTASSQDGEGARSENPKDMSIQSIKLEPGIKFSSRGRAAKRKTDMVATNESFSEDDSMMLEQIIDNNTSETMEGGQKKARMKRSHSGNRMGRRFSPYAERSRMNFCESPIYLQSDFDDNECDEIALNIINANNSDWDDDEIDEFTIDDVLILNSQELIQPMLPSLSCFLDQSVLVATNNFQNLDSVLAETVQNLDEELEKVIKSESSAAKQSLHLGCLSLAVQIESQFTESLTVKKVHLETVRDWMKSRPLELIALGRSVESKKPKSLSTLVKCPMVEIIVKHLGRQFRKEMQEIYDFLSDINLNDVSAQLNDVTEKIFADISYELDAIEQEFVINNKRGPIDELYSEPHKKRKNGNCGEKRKLTEYERSDLAENSADVIIADVVSNSDKVKGGKFSTNGLNKGASSEEMCKNGTMSEALKSEEKEKIPALLDLDLEEFCNKRKQAMKSCINVNRALLSFTEQDENISGLFSDSNLKRFGGNNLNLLKFRDDFTDRRRRMGFDDEPAGRRRRRSSDDFRRSRSRNHEGRSRKHRHGKRRSRKSSRHHEARSRKSSRHDHKNVSDERKRSRKLKNGDSSEILSALSVIQSDYSKKTEVDDQIEQIMNCIIFDDPDRLKDLLNSEEFSNNSELLSVEHSYIHALLSALHDPKGSNKMSDKVGKYLGKINKLQIANKIGEGLNSGVDGETVNEPDSIDSPEVASSLSDFYIAFPSVSTTSLATNKSLQDSLSAFQKDVKDFLQNQYGTEISESLKGSSKTDDPDKPSETICPNHLTKLFCNDIGIGRAQSKTNGIKREDEPDIVGVNENSVKNPNDVDEIVSNKIASSEIALNEEIQKVINTDKYVSDIVTETGNDLDSTTEETMVILHEEDLTDKESVRSSTPISTSSTQNTEKDFKNKVKESIQSSPPKPLTQHQSPKFMQVFRQNMLAKRKLQRENPTKFNEEQKLATTKAVSARPTIRSEKINAQISKSNETISKVLKIDPVSNDSCVIPLPTSPGVNSVRSSSPDSSINSSSVTSEHDSKAHPVTSNITVILSAENSMTFEHDSKAHPVTSNVTVTPCAGNSVTVTGSTLEAKPIEVVTASKEIEESIDLTTEIETCAKPAIGITRSTTVDIQVGGTSTSSSVSELESIQLPADPPISKSLSDAAISFSEPISSKSIPPSASKTDSTTPMLPPPLPPLFFTSPLPAPPLSLPVTPASVPNWSMGYTGSLQPPPMWIPRANMSGYGFNPQLHSNAQDSIQHSFSIGTNTAENNVQLNQLMPQSASTISNKEESNMQPSQLNTMPQSWPMSSSVADSNVLPNQLISLPQSSTTSSTADSLPVTNQLIAIPQLSPNFTSIAESGVPPMTSQLAHSNVKSNAEVIKIQEISETPQEGSLPGAVAKSRIYVYNLDKCICKSIQHFLTTTSKLRLFDPYNLTSVREIRNIDCVVLIHQSDLCCIQHVPNLLKLKRDLRVKFMTYASLMDIKNRSMKLVFPRGGLTVFDDASICNCSPDVLKSLCEFMKDQKKAKGKPWCLMITAHILEKLAELSSGGNSVLTEEHKARLAQIKELLETYRAASIVEVLSLPVDSEVGDWQVEGVTVVHDDIRLTQPRTTQDYLMCCLMQQRHHLMIYRHFLFISEMQKTHNDVAMFTNVGIDVMNIPAFMRSFVAQPSSKHFNLSNQSYSTVLTPGLYSDAKLSNAAQNAYK